MFVLVVARKPHLDLTYSPERLYHASRQAHIRHWGILGLTMQCIYDVARCSDPLSSFPLMGKT